MSANLSWIELCQLFFASKIYICCRLGNISALHALSTGYEMVTHTHMNCDRAALVLLGLSQTVHEGENAQYQSESQSPIDKFATTGENSV